jgi:hypothetical protein
MTILNTSDSSKPGCMPHHRRRRPSLPAGSGGGATGTPPVLVHTPAPRRPQQPPLPPEWPPASLGAQSPAMLCVLAPRHARSATSAESACCGSRLSPWPRPNMVSTSVFASFAIS